MSLMQWFKSLFTPRTSAPAAARGKASGKTPAKVPGRNEPCWCGSGKKYKQCHLRTDTEQRVEARYAAQFAKSSGEDGVTRTGGKPKKAGPQEYKEWKGGGKAAE